MNDYMYIISIVMPCHNRIALVKRAINSVKNSIGKNVELIVVDDCSSENIQEVVSCINTSHIQYIRTKRNIGGGGARNLGASIARGKFINFLDSDDFYLPNKLDYLVNYLTTNPNINLLITPVTVFKKGGGAFPITLDNPNLFRNGIFESIVRNNLLIQTNGLIIASKLFSNIRFNNELQKHQDLDLYIKLDNAKISAATLNTSCAAWDISHEMDSISKKNNPSLSFNWIKTVSPIITVNAYVNFSSKFICAKTSSIQELIFWIAILKNEFDLKNRLKFLFKSLIYFIRNRLKLYLTK